MLAHVRTHTNGMEYEVYFAAQQLLSLYKNILKIIVIGGISRNDWRINLL